MAALRLVIDLNHLSHVHFLRFVREGLLVGSSLVIVTGRCGYVERIMRIGPVAIGLETNIRQSHG